MKAPVIVFAIFSTIAAVGGFLIPISRNYEGEAVGLALLVLGFLGAAVLPFVILLARRSRPKE
ncbi:MAG: hypothetical protein ACYS9X_02425 [Planctomycetota bacterium]|jgi:hypothetical protein